MLRTRMALVTAILALAAACASVPTLNFNGDDAATASAQDGAPDGIGPDATSPNDADDVPDVVDVVDAGSQSDASGSDVALDGGGADAALLHKCGTKMVATCANCAGNPMLCLENGRDECLSDCQICNTALAPCVRCLPDGRPVGECVAPGDAGVIVCGHSAERCACGGDAAACPLFAGSDQTCVADGTGALGCETCGEIATTGASCVASLGTFGKCQKGGGKVGVCK